MVVANGIFHHRECVVVNITCLVLSVFFILYFRMPDWNTHLFITVVVALYNIMDSKRLTDTEMKSFLRIINVNKRSAYLSKFVDRLLPKHVSNSLH